MPFAEWFPRAAPPPFAGPWGTKYWTQIGTLFDKVRDLVVAALIARFPTFAPEDALEQIGRDRMLPRRTGESVPSYLARIQAAWTTWGPDAVVGGGGGTHLTLLQQLAGLGLPTGVNGATIVQQNGRYSQLVAGALSLGTLMNCVNRPDLTGAVPGNLPGWTFEGRPTFYSELGIVFPANVASLTLNSLLHAQLNAEVLKWKPSKMVYVGCWVIQSGRTLGWPTGRTLGTDPNLGGNVIRYLPPPGGNRVGYYP